jgi:hypothetical protein
VLLKEATDTLCNCLRGTSLAALQTAEQRLQQLGLASDCAAVVAERVQELTLARLSVSHALSEQLKVSLCS